MLNAKMRDLPNADQALPGRQTPIRSGQTHFVNGRDFKGGFPAGTEEAVFGLGCFWGAERLFWKTPGVYVTSVGYAGGQTANPTYEEVCSGRTGHTEVVRVHFDPKVVSYDALLKLFFESHDPTQGMRQGGDIGTQYRSAIYTTTPTQQEAAAKAAAAYDEKLRAAGFGGVTTELREAPDYFFAEEYHQQYLAKNPGGYCNIGGTGVSCPIGVGI